MNFEFDPAKSAANLKKHGIDFIGAQALWSDPDRLEISAPLTRRASDASHWANRRRSVVGLHHHAGRPRSDYLCQASPQ
jgi:uncharacterized DUF497 family protein